MNKAIRIHTNTDMLKLKRFENTPLDFFPDGGGLTPVCWMFRNVQQ